MSTVIRFISASILPVIIIYIIGFGILSKVNVYDSFIEGAKDGMRIVVDILPTLVGLIIAVGVLRASSFFDIIGGVLSPILTKMHMAVEVFSLMIIKMFSSSASTGLLLDVYETYGTDSFSGLMASLMLSSTETVFYTMSVYFMTAKVTKTRYTLCGALIATAAGVAASILFAGFLVGNV